MTLTPNTPNDLLEPLNYQQLLYVYSKDQELSESTLSSYRAALRALWKWAAAQNPPLAPDQLTTADLRQWRAYLRKDKQHSPGAANRMIAAVKSFYRWLHEQEHIAENPAAKLRHVKNHKDRAPARDELTDSEVLAVIRTTEAPRRGEHGNAELIRARDRAILSLMAYAGLRIVEIRRLRFDHLRTRGGRFTIDVHGKGRQEADQMMVLNEAAETALRDWLAIHPVGDGHVFISLSARSFGRVLDDSTIRRMVKSRYRQAGVFGERKTAHSLRHSFITKAIRAGLPPLEVQALARHGDLNTTVRYYHHKGRLDSPGEDRISYEAED
jgi:integrase/recombinase XerD